MNTQKHHTQTHKSSHIILLIEQHNTQQPASNQYPIIQFSGQTVITNAHLVQIAPKHIRSLKWLSKPNYFFIWASWGLTTCIHNLYFDTISHLSHNQIKKQGANHDPSCGKTTMELPTCKQNCTCVFKVECCEYHWKQYGHWPPSCLAFLCWTSSLAVQQV